MGFWLDFKCWEDLGKGRVNLWYNVFNEVVVWVGLLVLMFFFSREFVVGIVVRVLRGLIFMVVVI